MQHAGGRKRKRAVQQEEILNVDQLGYVYVEKYNIKIDTK